MNKYKTLRTRSPKLEVTDNAREVIINTIASMCDNKGKLTLKKNSEGDFKMCGNGFAISNWQMKYDRDEIEWEADNQNWNEVFRMINTGTSVIESVRSR